MYNLQIQHTTSRTYQVHEQAAYGRLCQHTSWWGRWSGCTGEHSEHSGEKVPDHHVLQNSKPAANINQNDEVNCNAFIMLTFMILEHSETSRGRNKNLGMSGHTAAHTQFCTDICEFCTAIVHNILHKSRVYVKTQSLAWGLNIHSHLC